MYRMTIQVPGGTMEVPGDSLEAVIKAASFLQNLPTVCPVDGTPTRLNYRKAGGFEYFGLVSTGSPQYTYPFGRPLEKGDEFFEGKFVKQGKEGETRRQWCYYDHGKQEQVVVWEDGKLLVNVQRGGKPTDKEAIAPSSNGTDELVQWAVEALPLRKLDYPTMEEQQKIDRRKTLNLAGREVYGDEWPEKCGAIVQWYTDNQVADSERLTVEQLDGLIIKLRNKKAKKVGV